MWKTGQYGALNRFQVFEQHGAHQHNQGRIWYSSIIEWSSNKPFPSSHRKRKKRIKKNKEKKRSMLKIIEKNFITLNPMAFHLKWLAHGLIKWYEWEIPFGCLEFMSIYKGEYSKRTISFHVKMFPVQFFQYVYGWNIPLGASVRACVYVCSHIKALVFIIRPLIWVTRKKEINV